MSEKFPDFAVLFELAFQGIVEQDTVLVADIEPDELFRLYLEAFPEGTNPHFRERTEHDCSTCKQVIRRVGGVVAVDGKNVMTAWDAAAAEAPYPYNEVATALRDKLREAKIADLFFVAKSEVSFGAKQTHAKVVDKKGKWTGDVETWNHLYTGEIPKTFRRASPDADRGRYRTDVQVFQRGMEELSIEALDTVSGLISSNAIYRGEEHQRAVLEFAKAKREYDAATPRGRELMVWSLGRSPIARFRNTVIGTLVTDLSDGVELEAAVGKYESKVAPHNYKRTTALITPGMVKEAMKTIEELELEPALDRRFARIEDISVNDVLWVDGTVKPLMKGGIGDVLMEHAVASSTPSTSSVDAEAEAIGIDKFMAEVLPKTTTMEVLLRGEHLGNLMSLTAPVNPEPRRLFSWDNDFAWSYCGNVADSIKERVKRAGGNVTNAALRVSLSWFNYDDLDLHIIEPCGDHIYFSHMRGRGGGHLDVDMNAGSGQTREAVENVAWVTAKDGIYEVKVHNFAKRENVDVGFVIETEAAGRLGGFSYAKAVPHNHTVHVATLYVENGIIQDFEVQDEGVVATGAIAQSRWGLSTEHFIKVNAVTLSPNYWGNNAVGNKHTFFVLDGAVNDEPTRGIYNEFLHSRLTKHRKVFEIIGEKTKCQPTEGQLSGLGFSSTKKASVIVKVQQGRRRHLYNVQFGA